MKFQVQLLALCCALLLSGCSRIKAVACSMAGKEAKERVLKQDLFALRSSIDQYTMDRQQAPHSLDELVRAGYLRTIAIDPITKKRDWVPIQDDSLMSAGQIEPGISDVHSASQATACDGTQYANW